MPENKWSFSKLSLADSCHRLFQSQYEVPRDQVLPLLYDNLRETGKGVHRCREMYIEHLIATGMEQDLSVCSLIVEEYFATDPEVVSTDCYKDVLQVFTAFAKRYRHNPATYFGGEILTDRELPETDVVVAGFPDAISEMEDEDGSILVATDMKAGYSSSVTESNKLQGEIEAWKLQAWFPDRRVGWQVSWPRAGSDSPIHEFKPNYSPVLEARLRAIIRRVEIARENNYWPAQPGAACGYCPLAANCRERNVLAENSVIVTNAEEALKAAQDLVLVDAAYKQRREQVKNWTAEHGAIMVHENLEAGFFPATEGMKIGDISMLLMRLGLWVLVRDGVFDSEDDPRAKTKDGQNMIAAAGAQVAIKEELIRVNGDKTKLKGVQNDERLNGLWVLGDSKTKFDVYKPKPKVV